MTDIEHHTSSLEDDPRTLTLRRSAAPSVAMVGLRYRRLIVYSVLMLAAAAVAYGVLREPTYTAESQINIGRTDLRTQAIPGFVEAAKALATSYSEVAEGGAVTSEIARTTGIRAGEIRSRVNASAVPDSPTFRIEATGATEGDAVALAAAATRSTVAFIQERNAAEDQAADLLRRYRETSRRASDLRATADRLRGRLEAGTTSDTTELEERIRDATLEASTAELEAETLSVLYQQAREASQGRLTLEVIRAAAASGSDRFAVLQQLLFIAIVSGVVFGMGCALLLSRRSRRR